MNILETFQHYLKNPHIDIRLLYDFNLLTEKNYSLIKKEKQKNENLYGISQIEHDLGRFTVIKKIVEYLFKNDIEGDFVEYGCWKGHSLYNTLNIMEKIGIRNRKLLGIDGFIGIPKDCEHVNWRVVGTKSKVVNRKLKGRGHYKRSCEHEK